MELRRMAEYLSDDEDAFAELLGIPKRSIENWESGVSKPPEYLSSASSVFASITGKIESVKGVFGGYGPQNNITEKSKKPVTVEVTGFFLVGV